MTLWPNPALQPTGYRLARPVRQTPAAFPCTRISLNIPAKAQGI